MLRARVARSGLERGPRSADASAMDPAALLQGLVCAAAGVLLWLAYFDRKDALRPEPRGRLALAFAAGTLSPGLAWLLYLAVGGLGGARGPGPPGAGAVLFSLAVIGPVEEGAKYLVGRLVVFRWRSFDEPVDGLVYGAAIGIGFAAVETLLALASSPGPSLPLLARALAAPLTHGLFGGLAGLGVSLARFGEGRAGLPPAALELGGLAAAALAHGAYDALLLGAGSPPAAAVLVGVLWLSLLAALPRIAAGPGTPRPGRAPRG